MVAALAQHQSGSNFGTTVTATFSPGTTTGRLLTAVVQAQQATDCTGIADSAGNTWVKAGSLFVTAQKHVEIWYSVSAVSCTTVTATLGATSANVNMSIQEWSGSTGWTLRNVNSVANASGGTATATVTCVPGDIVLTGLAYLEAVSGTRQDTLGTGVALDSLARGTTAFSSAYSITTGTTDGASWTMSPAVSSAVAVASFAPPVGGGGGGGTTGAALAQNQPGSNFGTTVVATFSPATTGNRLLTCVVQAQQSTDATGITDSAGNTWVKGASVYVTVQKHITIWYAVNAAPCTTVTVALGATGVNANISIQEWSGTSGWTLRDQNAAASASTSTATNTAVCVAGDIVLSGLGYLEAVAGTRHDILATGVALDTLARGTTAFATAYRITTLTSDGCAWTMSPTVSSAVATASFGPVATAPSLTGGVYVWTGTQWKRGVINIWSGSAWIAADVTS